jgi:hypothetical protein
MMKDAQGHGSNPRGKQSAHMKGVMKATKPIKVKPEVLAHIQANPGGFSVTPRGQTPENGFMVSVPGRTRIVNESDLSGPNGHAIINDYAAEHSDALRQRGAHIGGWTDKETGKTYLDISQKIGSRSRAISAGKKRNQIAIWDVKKGREIRTGGTGE